MTSTDYGTNKTKATLMMMMMVINFTEECPLSVIFMRGGSNEKQREADRRRRTVVKKQSSGLRSWETIYELFNNSLFLSVFSLLASSVSAPPPCLPHPEASEMYQAFFPWRGVSAVAVKNVTGLLA
jgi:hypothetical protein